MNPTVCSAQGEASAPAMGQAAVVLGPHSACRFELHPLTSSPNPQAPLCSGGSLRPCHGPDWFSHSDLTPLSLFRGSAEPLSPQPRPRCAQGGAPAPAMGQTAPMFRPDAPKGFSSPLEMQAAFFPKSNLISGRPQTPNPKLLLCSGGSFRPCPGRPGSPEQAGPSASSASWPAPSPSTPWPSCASTSSPGASPTSRRAPLSGPAVVILCVLESLATTETAVRNTWGFSCNGVEGSKGCH